MKRRRPEKPPLEEVDDDTVASIPPQKKAKLDVIVDGHIEETQIKPIPPTLKNVALPPPKPLGFKAQEQVVPKQPAAQTALPPPPQDLTPKSLAALRLKSKFFVPPPPTPSREQKTVQANEPPSRTTLHLGGPTQLQSQEQQKTSPSKQPLALSLLQRSGGALQNRAFSKPLPRPAAPVVPAPQPPDQAAPEIEEEMLPAETSAEDQEMLAPISNSRPLPPQPPPYYYPHGYPPYPYYPPAPMPPSFFDQAQGRSTQWANRGVPQQNLEGEGEERDFYGDRNAPQASNRGHPSPGYAERGFTPAPYTFYPPPPPYPYAPYYAPPPHYYPTCEFSFESLIHHAPTVGTTISSNFHLRTLSFPSPTVSLHSTNSESAPCSAPTSKVNLQATSLFPRCLSARPLATSPVSLPSLTK